MTSCRPVDTPMDPNSKLLPGQREPLSDPARYRRLVVVRILRYIKSTSRKGLLFEDRGHEQIVGYSDVDWARSHSDKHSTSEYCVLVGGNLVSWKSKKQNMVARSSAEVEYQVMAMATCELIWIKRLLKELKFGEIS
ncbi:secreted RxLR effector protein 161-like [Nicotiana sylvestris]|uniref:secreted RxLR effector protein 161-like n=1 Tax=Nicotiana sylvestris TaxID=4096 RepID=UPI00388C7261